MLKWNKIESVADSVKSNQKEETLSAVKKRSKCALTACWCANVGLSLCIEGQGRFAVFTWIGDAAKQPAYACTHIYRPYEQTGFKVNKIFEGCELFY